MLRHVNRVYVRGVGFMGQLGLENGYQNSPIFVPIPRLDSVSVKNIWGSWAQSAALLETGELLTWGWPLDVRSQMQVA